jgi:hypothetical protein
MVNEEIYILTKHAKFQADYIENLPIYRRRHFLFLLERENDEIKKLQEQAQSKINFKSRK